MEVLTGHFSFYLKLSVLILQVVKNWRSRCEEAPSETDCKRIKSCLEIGLSCIKTNKRERPDIREILEIFYIWESANFNVSDEERPTANQVLSLTKLKLLISTRFCSIRMHGRYVFAIHLLVQKYPNYTVSNIVFHKIVKKN